jgi:hypothetical protein
MRENHHNHFASGLDFMSLTQRKTYVKSYGKHVKALEKLEHGGQVLHSFRV